MTLGEKQRLFASLLPKLIEWAFAHGYEVTLGESKRSDEQAEINAIGKMGRERVADLLSEEFSALAAKIRNNTGSGIRGSTHEMSLAQDLNLFRDGIYLTETDDHRPLGEYWESLYPLCRWGGRFGDGNHYSITHEGVR